MEFKLIDRLFNYFGPRAKSEDSYKDVNGKGINQRYQESIAQDYDDNISDLIDNGLDNLVVPKTLKSNLIPLTEYMLGGIVLISNSEAIRRKMIRFAHELYNVKGTFRGYEIPLKIIGFTLVEIIPTYPAGGFDSDTGFDDPVRTFDSNPNCGCSKYTLQLTGSFAITDAILDAVSNIITFNQPINVELIEVIYITDDSITADSDEITVDDDTITSDQTIF